jgi:NodT family efflux transporter outer membrane factor (OMF) lipoprotein
VRAVGLGACALLLALAGCTVGPDYTAPAPPAIAAWKDPVATGPAVSEASNPDPRWWNGFDDPTLTTLIDRAIAGNLDLQQAVLRVVAARETVVATRAAGLPTLGGQASYMREQLGLRGLLQSQGMYSQLNELADQNSPLNRLSPGLGNAASGAIGGALNQLVQPVNLFQYGFDASWQLDLFGRVRRSVQQAAATTEAQAEDANDALVMLESEVAQAYMQLRGAQALAASQEDNVRAAQQALELTRRREIGGLANDLDVDQARTELYTYQQQLPGYEKQAEQAINRLSVLTGQAPGALDGMLAARAPLPTLPQIVRVGVPSTLARRRPDIREAEAQLHAATANIGVAVANFYPDISLTGSIGLRATDASYLTNWASLFYSVGPSVSLPIFQGGKLTASLRMARAQAAAAALHYRAMVLNALREVEDGLVSYRTDRATRDKLAETVGSAQDTLFLATDRYKFGLADFIQVLDAERSVVSARQLLVQADLNLADDVVALYRALGGGWQDDVANSNPAPVAAPPPMTPAALDGVAAKLPGHL